MRTCRKHTIYIREKCKVSETTIIIEKTLDFILIASIVCLILCVLLLLLNYKKANPVISNICEIFAIIAAIVSILVYKAGTNGGAETTPAPSTSAPSTPVPPTKIPEPPVTDYGKAVVNENYYSDDLKMGLISASYYNRKDEFGEYRYGYTSKRNTENETGYHLGLYYADGLLYYAEVIQERHGSEKEKILVKLYYWGNELLACDDCRVDNSSVCYAGSDTYERINEEFGDVYEIGMNT